MYNPVYTFYVSFTDFGMDPWMAGALPLYSSDSESASESESEEDDAEEAQLQLGATASTGRSPFVCYGDIYIYIYIEIGNPSPPRDTYRCDR